MIKETHSEKKKLIILLRIACRESNCNGIYLRGQRTHNINLLQGLLYAGMEGFWDFLQNSN